MDFNFQYLLNKLYSKFLVVATKPAFKYQIIAILIVFIISFLIKKLIELYLTKTNTSNKNKFKLIIKSIYASLETYLYYVFVIALLSIAYKIDFLDTKSIWLIGIVQTFSALVLINKIIKNNIKDNIKKTTAQLIILPVIFLLFFGWLDDVNAFFGSYNIIVGNITITLNGIIRTVIFGLLLFWLFRSINLKGKELIKKQKSLDSRSKGLYSKFYEMAIYLIFFVLMIQITGVDITALLIFGGAIGVGLGLGLQSISSNFISGIILLMDRSLSLGDHIELEDGRQGTVRELNMRSVILESYEGKDILVPNEKFISDTFINWTHENEKQRYSINLQVSYKTDLHKLFDLIRETVSKHPQVYSGDSVPIEERPDAEIESFGDSGVNILIEYWMDGIDDGKNRVGADILLMLWDAFKEKGIIIPYPQREVNLIGGNI